VDADEMLAAKFVCPKCSASGGSVKRIAMSGTGLSRFFDIQHNRFIVVSCKNCGFSEMYNPEIMEGKKTLSDILDFIFGG